MQLKPVVWAVLIAASASNLFGQGYATVTAPNGFIWDEFTTPGIPKRANADVDVAFLWNTNNAPGFLPSLGTAGNFSHRGSPSNEETATNGVNATFPGITGIQCLLANGWSWASNGLSFVSTTTAALGNFVYNSGNPFQLAGTTAGDTYEFIIVGWNSSAGADAILSGNVTDLGWSNPITYLTGTNSSDNGFGPLSGEGMNQFGIAPIPEPTTFALAGLGAVLLVFRRRKS